ncbi:MAG: ribosome small subunit-dependent GTPase A [Spirochaetota bacterium]|nr:ribosome small subunit-dependent GTPase A [Spirochaetota bacterium]
MKLRDLGFDDWFMRESKELIGSDYDIARVTTVYRSAYVIRNEEKELSAELSGKYRYDSSHQELPVVGDWVGVSYQDGDSPAVIHKVLPRKTFLRRKTPGRLFNYQMMASNIDVAFIVQSCHYDFNIKRLERYLVMILEGQIHPVIILSKTDLISPDELNEKISEIHGAGMLIPILSLSNETGEGLNELRDYLEAGKTYCLMGSSGVGKTTLINRVIGREEYETREVSQSGEGCHTTTQRQLIVLETGAMIIDTPGMRELGITGAIDGLEESFSDIVELAEACRFKDCGHNQEPGCAVLKSLEEGVLSEERYASYQKLRKESEYRDMNHVDKRQKDRAFGKFVKSAKKGKKK